MLIMMRSGKRGTAPANAAPVNTVAPVISGSPVVGSTLTASQGSWTGFPTPTYAYQWKKDAVAISGATSTTYVPVTGDIGGVITVTVTATNSQAPGGVAATSAGTAAVTAAGGGTAGILDFSDNTNSAHVATIGA